MHEKILNIILEENEVTWQDIIYGLIKSEEMDPWDIDISLLTHKFLDTVKELKETNFYVSGKVLLAAALLVRIKSVKLVDEDIANFDSILFPQTGLDDEDDMGFVPRPLIDVPPLCMRTPQARKRRVSVQDLIRALQRALTVSNRRMLRKNKYFTENIPGIPERKVNISDIISRLFERIKSFFTRKEEVTFSKLLPEGNVGKREKILTLLPLLHLDTQKKIDLDQPQHFSEIYIREKHD